MPSHCLRPRPVERVWGRHVLPAGFPRGARSGAPVGEIWFEEDGAPDLLVKYLFTSERLSIQVHPDDAAARALGLKHGKDEAWLVLDAEPGAVVGLGLRREVSPGALRAAALDGSIEALVDWRPARPGDLLYSPAGTVHAIGGGISLVEIQQNIDLTYRLYDYGRPRELHLDDALAVADRKPWAARFDPVAHGPGRRILAAESAFAVERWTFSGSAVADAGERQMLLIPLADGGLIDGAALVPGTVWAVDASAAIEAPAGADLLVAYPGAEVRDAALARWPQRSKLRA